MKIGCFGFTNQLQQIADAGYDCAELDICEIVAMTREEFDRFCISARESNLSFEVFSGLFPLSIRIFDLKFDRNHWLDHVEIAAQRISQLDAKMIPFGAGKCRSIPENCNSVEECKAKLLQFIRDICTILKRYDIKLVIEPLGPANSNYLNYIEETYQFTQEVAMDNCSVMCDLRHMVKNKESLTSIVKYQDVILHAHIDNPLGEKRLFPQNGDGYDYIPYLQTLKQAGYNKILTVEATSYQDFSKEAHASAVYLRELLTRLQME